MDQIVVLMCVIAEHNALDLHSGAIYQGHVEDFCQFLIPAGKLSVGLVQNPHHKFPSSLEVNKEVRDLLKVFELIFSHIIVLFLISFHSPVLRRRTFNRRLAILRCFLAFSLHLLFDRRLDLLLLLKFDFLSECEFW